MRNTDVDSVLGRVGGCSGGGGGEAISKDGLEQFPTAALDREPLWDKAVLDGVVSGLVDGDGVEEEKEMGEHCLGDARLTSDRCYIDTIF